MSQKKKKKKSCQLEIKSRGGERAAWEMHSGAFPGLKWERGSRKGQKYPWWSVCPLQSVSPLCLTPLSAVAKCWLPEGHWVILMVSPPGQFSDGTFSFPLWPCYLLEATEKSVYLDPDYCVLCTVTNVHLAHRDILSGVAALPCDFCPDRQ